jgi:hypothetical protein
VAAAQPGAFQTVVAFSRRAGPLRVLSGGGEAAPLRSKTSFKADVLAGSAGASVAS